MRPQRGPQEAQAEGLREEPGRRLAGGQPRRDEIDAVEPETRTGLGGQVQVPPVDRAETAAEDADPHATDQARTWPRPVTTYL